MAPKPRAKKRVTQPWNPNEGPDPVWLAQINETWHHGESVVRLPHTDFRKPSLWPGQEQEREQEQERRQGQWLQQQEQLLDDTSANEAGFATQATQCLNLNLNLLTPLAHSSSLAPSNSTSTSPAPSSLPIQTPPQNQLHFEPRSQSYSQSYCESQSILSPGSNVNHRNHGSYIPNPHVRYASTLHRWPFTRGTRGRGDPRNAGMKETQARFRTEQARRKIERPDFVGHFNAGASAKSSFNSSGADQSYQTPIIVPTLEVDMAVRTPSQPPVYHCLPPKPSQHRPQSNANMNGLYNSSSSFGRANTSSSRPSLQKYPLQPSLLYQQNGAVARRPDDWTTWNELRIKVYGLSPNVSTRDLWKAFSKEGSIAAIEIFEDSNGNREGKATIRFRYVSILKTTNETFHG